MSSCLGYEDDEVLMESNMERIISKLKDEITNLKKKKGEGKKLVKKKTNKNTSPRIPPTSRINLEDYAMDNFCHAHYANHSEKNCTKFMNLFKAMILRRELQEEDEEEEKEEEE